MNRHLTGVMAAVLAATVLLAAPTFADHRPGNVVVIGGTISLTGRFVVQVRPTHDARKLYVDELNARGGLLGHKVELKILDDKSDARTARAGAPHVRGAAEERDGQVKTTGGVCLNDGKYGQMAFRTRENRKIRPSVGCGENSVPSTVVRGYDLRKPGGHLGNVG